jgi:hypothetical protein
MHQYLFDYGVLVDEANDLHFAAVVPAEQRSADCECPWNIFTPHQRWNMFYAISLTEGSIPAGALLKV